MILANIKMLDGKLAGERIHILISEYQDILREMSQVEGMFIKFGNDVQSGRQRAVVHKFTNALSELRALYGNAIDLLHKMPEAVSWRRYGKLTPYPHYENITDNTPGTPIKKRTTFTVGPEFNKLDVWYAVLSSKDHYVVLYYRGNGRPEKEIEVPDSACTIKEFYRVKERIGSVGWI